MSEKILYEKESFEIIGLAMKVHSELGFGFIERVYENSFLILLAKAGFAVQQQMPIQVKFQGAIVGDFVADIVVDRKIILELKACQRIREEHKAQTLNYLRATDIRLGLLFNFGEARLEYKRFVN